MSEFPNSIREINTLDDNTKISIYKSLIPDWVYSEFSIDPDTFIKNQNRVIIFRCSAGSRVVEIIVRNDAKDIDPILYLNMADTFNNQLLVLLVQVNDPYAPRFNVDFDAQGNFTNFGTSGRNIPAEIAAMHAGLAPGQVRKGLRVFRKTVPIFEDFVNKMGHELFFIEPLAYHNAIVFERYGFNYLRGLREMEQINHEFNPDGDYYSKLNNESPFRQQAFWKTIRGRSWAIHDGILGHSFTGFQMYKRIGKHAGIDTFPHAEW